MNNIIEEIKKRGFDSAGWYELQTNETLKYFQRHLIHVCLDCPIETDVKVCLACPFRKLDAIVSTMKRIGEEEQREYEKNKEILKKNKEILMKNKKILKKNKEIKIK